MKVIIRKNVTYDDVGTDFKMHPSSIFRLLQNAAIAHSDQVGFGPDQLYRNGFSWMLSKMALSIDRYPKYNDEVVVSTWSKGVNGFKAYRDFVLSVNGQAYLKATSLWVYIDLKKKRIQSIPAEIETVYAIENEHAMNDNLDQWRPLKNHGCEKKSDVFLRFSDFDSNKHVNNSVYIEYIEDHLYQCYQPEKEIKLLRIQFSKEISAACHHIRIESQCLGSNNVVFRIVDDQNVFACGECNL